MAGINSLEIEIHNLFQEGTSPEYVGRELVAKYEKNEVLSPAEIEGLSHFLITSGRFDLLKKLYIRCLRHSKLSLFPTGHFIKALKEQEKPLTDLALNICDKIIESQPFESTALQNTDVLNFSIQINKERLELEKKFNSERLLQKTRLIEQLNNYRTASLFDQEEQVLKKLTSLYPLDLEIGLLKQAQLEKKADEILNRVITHKSYSKSKSNLDKSSIPENFLIETENNILQIAQQLATSQPDQLYNLAILAFQFEFYEVAVSILNQAPETAARDWLLAEVLLEAGRYLDLLELTKKLESTYAGLDSLDTLNTFNASDATFGAVYFRAIAYHGLGEKDFALQLMQSILNVVPFYRSAESYIAEWSSLNSGALK